MVVRTRRVGTVVEGGGVAASKRINLDGEKGDLMTTPDESRNNE
jgi:hypothetical protein